MLTERHRVGERITVGPASAWFHDELWLAYGALDGTLVVRSVNVRHNPAVTMRHTAGVAAGETVSMAVWAGRLYVMFGTSGGGYQLISTQNGFSFAPATFLPIANGFVGFAGLAGHAQGLAILWAENAGGRAHLLQTGDGGATVDDTTLPFAVVPSPGLTFELSTGDLILGFGYRQGGPGSFTIAAINPDKPAILGRSFATTTPFQSRNVAICATSYHNRAGVHVAIQKPAAVGLGRHQGRTALADLARVGGEEAFLHQAHVLSLTFDGVRAWTAWRDEADELWVAPYVTVFDLPTELRDRLGEECGELNCPVDPRLVCAATDEKVWRWTPPRIENARRGDLVLTPGDGTGLIGTLLEQLEPKQRFDHMGIMVRDYDLVRHATMAHDRLNRRDPGRFMTGTFFGDRAPVDGFRADALTYGWPGTITQSVEDAFYTGFNTVNPATGQAYNVQGDFFALNPTAVPLPLPPETATDKEREQWNNQHRFADPEFPADVTFGITNLPRLPAYRIDTGDVIDAVVVKPDPALEAADARIRPMLHRVAEAADQINGHYRFYSYTDARIALDPGMVGLPGTWAEATRPMVCSSFVWAAIQLANARLPHIEIEGRVTERPEELLASPTVDGLYRYLANEREAAAEALHTLVSEKVRKQVYLALQEAEHDKRLEITLGRIGLTAILTLLGGPIGAAASILGITPTNVAKLKLLFEDMPDDVATQLCNTFAQDRADETDDRLWESPGEGIAVSPDDIKEFWDAPEAPTARKWHGLYGTSQKMLLTTGRFEPRRVHRLARSQGPAYVFGAVNYRGNPVGGAEVRYSCDTVMTSSNAHQQLLYQIELGAGRYEVVATAYWPSSEQMLAGRRVVDVVAGDQPGPIDIELEDPPQWRRLIRCLGKIDLVRKVVIGSDDWAHSAINDQSTMIKAPSDWGTPPPGASVQTWKTHWVSAFAQRFNVRVDLQVELKDDLSIVVTTASALCEHYYDHSRGPTGNEIVTSKVAAAVTIGADGKQLIIVDHDSGNFPPDRAHVEFTIENLRAPA